MKTLSLQLYSLKLLAENFPLFELLKVGNFIKVEKLNKFISKYFIIGFRPHYGYLLVFIYPENDSYNYFQGKPSLLESPLIETKTLEIKSDETMSKKC